MERIKLPENIITESFLLYLQDTELINEGLLLEGLTFDKIKSSFLSNVNKVENVLKEYGVDITSIKSSAKSLSVNLKKEFEKGVSPEDMGKQLSKMVAKKVFPFIDTFKKKLIQTTENKTVLEKVAIAVGLLIILLFIQVFFVSLTSVIIRNDAFTTIFTALIIAPITEEALKSYFILKGMPWVGVSIIFGFELIGYVIAFLLQGMSLPKILMLRAITLLMHFGTTYLQKSMIDNEKIGKYVEPSTVYKAWFAGVLCHCAFNTLATFSGI